MDKVILTNHGALKAKYGAAGATAVKNALKKLVAADKKRGLKSLVVLLDSAAEMKLVNAPVVTNPASTRQNKLAVDAIYKFLSPAYIVLVGSVDVIPHQSLINPVFDGSNDPDRLIPSDLPYACDTPFGSDVTRFTGPTRVVGRIPDLTKGRDPKYLLGLIDTAINWTSRPRTDYAAYLGMSARVWEDSTAQSLQNVFGASDDLQVIPPATFAWSDALLGRRAHFINCHGALANQHFYGQQGSSYPIAHDAAHLASHQISEGTVVAAECCYGGELYDPSLTNGVAGICSTYMAKKAYAFFGSTTIAYGPATGNGSADLICQYFLNHVLAGASIGRAALMARQEFVRNAGLMDPVDQKTLGQFVLLGDPSVQPVQTTTPHTLVGKSATDQPMRAMRRRQLSVDGQQLAKSVPVAKAMKDGAGAGKIGTMLKKLIKSSELNDSQVLSFSVAGPGPAGRAAKGAASGPSNIHVVLGRRDGEGKEDEAQLSRGVALVVWEQGGKVTSYRELEQR